MEPVDTPELLLARDTALEILAQWVYDHVGDSIGATMLNLYGMALPDKLEPYVRAIGPHRFAPAGVLAAWVCGRELPPVPEQAPAPARPRRTRPYRLGHTDEGILFEQWGRYGTAEAAWRRADRDMGELEQRDMQHLMTGWLVVTGPDGYCEARGIGRDEGKPLPVYTATNWATPAP